MGGDTPVVERIGQVIPGRKQSHHAFVVVLPLIVVHEPLGTIIMAKVLFSLHNGEGFVKVAIGLSGLVQEGVETAQVVDERFEMDFLNDLRIIW